MSSFLQPLFFCLAFYVIASSCSSESRFPQIVDLSSKAKLASPRVIDTPILKGDAPLSGDAEFENEEPPPIDEEKPVVAAPENEEPPPLNPVDDFPENEEPPPLGDFLTKYVSGLPSIKSNSTVQLLREGRCETKDCRLLLTGCGRSGTRYLADELIKNKVRVKHEQIDADGSVSWTFGPVSQSRYLFPSENDLNILKSHDFSWFPVVQVVRHPLTAISSLARCFCGCGALNCGPWIDATSWEFASSFVSLETPPLYPVARRSPNEHNNTVNWSNGRDQLFRIKRAAQYWLRWNEMVEKSAQFRVLLETFTVADLVEAVVVLPKVDTVKFQPSQPGGRNMFFTEVTWNHLRKIDPQLEAAVWSMAERYGYDRDPVRGPPQ